MGLDDLTRAMSLQPSAEETDPRTWTVDAQVARIDQARQHDEWNAGAYGRERRAREELGVPTHLKPEELRDFIAQRAAGQKPLGEIAEA